MHAACVDPDVVAAPIAQPLDRAQQQRLQAGFSLLQQGRASDAHAHAAALAQHAPAAPDAQHLLALCLATLGQADAADAAFGRALALAPGHALLLRNHARFLRNQGRDAEALPLLRELLASHAADVALWIELALVQAELGDHHASADAARRALALEPQRRVAWHALGNALQALEQSRGAAQAYARMIALAPDAADGWTLLGGAQRRAGRADLAVDSFEQALSRPDVTPGVAEARIGALLDAGRSDEALAQAKALVEREPGNASALAVLADLVWEYGGGAAPDKAAAAVFEHALATRLDDPALALAQIRFLLAAGQAEAALARAEDVCRRHPHPNTQLHLAQALDATRRFPQAAAIYERLYGQAQDNAGALLGQFARHLLRVGDFARAADIAGEAAARNRFDQNAWACLATAWRMLDDPREHWLCDYQRLVGHVPVEPPPGLDGAGFLETLRKTLEPLHQARQAPMTQSLRGGTQTPGRLFGRPDPIIEATRVQVLRAIEQWLAQLPEDATHPFLSRRRASVDIGGSWSVRLWSSDRHENHIHGDGWMSSAFYVALPPSVLSQSVEGAAPPGAIGFGQPPADLVPGLAPRRLIRPCAGWLALFPSYLWHGTTPFADPQPRITIAFDMLPADAAEALATLQPVGNGVGS